MHLLNGTLSRTTRVSRYQKGKTNLDFTETRDSEWQWHQLDHMQVCISLQTDNHASTPPLETFDMTIRHNGRPKRMELEFSRWIYFHLRSKIFFWPSYGKRGEGAIAPITPPPNGSTTDHAWSLPCYTWTRCRLNGGMKRYSRRQFRPLPVVVRPRRPVGSTSRMWFPINVLLQPCRKLLSYGHGT